MSDRDFHFVETRLRPLRAAAAACGCALAEPILQLAFLPLPVIPHLKLTDRGYVAAGPDGLRLTGLGVLRRLSIRCGAGRLWLPRTQPQPGAAGWTSTRMPSARRAVDGRRSNAWPKGGPSWPWRRRSTSIPRPCANGVLRSSPRVRPAWPTARRGLTPARTAWPGGTRRDPALRRQRLSGPAIARRLGRPSPPSAWSCAAAASAGSHPRPQARARPLPARAARPAHPHRHQEAGPDRRRRAPHHRRPALGRAASAGTSFTSASTTPRASPTPRSSPTNGRRARSPSSSARSPGSPASASPSSGSSPTTARPIAATPSARRSSTPGSAERTRPYTPRTNSKANDLSRPACANGPTCKHSPAQPSAAPPCSPGSTATTDTDPTQPLAASLPPPD